MGGIECLARVTGEPVWPARALVKDVPAKPAGGRVAPDSFKTPDAEDHMLSPSTSLLPQC